MPATKKSQTILGKKIGMTRWFTEEGKNIPVTVIQAGPCRVTQVKTVESDGYAAVQLAFDELKARNSTQPVIGHDLKAGTETYRVHREVRCDNDAESGAFELGQTVDLSILEGVKFVDVIGTSKGKGFQGGMVRHGFKGFTASHGTERKHRAPGSIGSHGTDRGHGAKIKKGKKMAGHMGDERVTMRSLDIVSIDLTKNMLVVKGAVPGATNGDLIIRAATRLWKPKARIQAKG
ncbi:MAG: 50S ribosomal protein L3 [Planctomycetota bacterium]|nr:50S ribosomal protein L3 [Planctomycetota bacterium]MDA1105246.1 50S ribosomal protein L3 [Planctomycetota bacterium]